MTSRFLNIFLLGSTSHSVPFLKAHSKQLPALLSSHSTIRVQATVLEFSGSPLFLPDFSLIFFELFKPQISPLLTVSQVCSNLSCHLCPCDSSLELENPTHFCLSPQTFPSSGLPQLYFLCPIIPLVALVGFIHTRTHAISRTFHFSPFTPICLGQRPCLPIVGAAEMDEGGIQRRSCVNIRRASTFFFPEWEWACL